MLYIHTKTGENTVMNIESQFLLRYNDVKRRFPEDPHVLEALEKIEGMKDRREDVILGKYGAVALRDVSMGMKALILAVLYGGELTVSTDEMGYNCIFELCRISRDVDVHIYSSAPYNYFPEGVEADIDGQFCGTVEEVLETMEERYEEYE